MIKRRRNRISSMSKKKINETKRKKTEEKRQKSVTKDKKILEIKRINEEQKEKVNENSAKISKNIDKEFFNKDNKNYDDNNDDEYWPLYGNNYFSLTTYDNSKKIKLNGILSDLPEIGLSTKWGDGPAKSIADMLNMYLNSDLMEMLNAVTNNERAWVMTNAGTDKSYESTEYISFDLNFKIYTQEKYGEKNFSSWKEWLTYLILYTMPNEKNILDIDSFTKQLKGIEKNILEDLDNIKNNISNITSNVKDSKSFTEVFGILTTGFKNSLNKVYKNTIKNYKDDRVKGNNNNETYFGAKLWNLRIFPYIFKTAIPIIIKNWNITYSKERSHYNGDDENKNNEPIYIIFKLSCQLDQIPSQKKWINLFK